MVPTSKIRIKLTAFDHRVLMESVEEIVKTAKRTGAFTACMGKGYRKIQHRKRIHQISEAKAGKGFPEQNNIYSKRTRI